MPLARMMRGCIQKLGYDIIVGRKNSLDIRTLWLDRLKIDLILDIGANEGQYVGWMRDRKFSGSIISFEPQKDAFERLQRRWNRDPNWHGYNIALGESNGVIEFQIAGNSVSSSVLPMLSTHVDALPESAVTSTVMVPIERIDGVHNQNINNAKSLCMKIDTQGFELAVLAGAAGILGKTSLLEIELSLVPLYAGQPLMDEVVKNITAQGFTLVWIEQGFSSPDGERMLQVDGIFVATHLLAPQSETRINA